MFCANIFIGELFALKKQISSQNLIFIVISGRKSEKGSYYSILFGILM